MIRYALVRFIGGAQMSVEHILSTHWRNTGWNRIMSDIFSCVVDVLWKTIKAKMTEAGKMLSWNEWMHRRGKHSLGDKINNPLNVRWRKIGTKFSSFIVSYSKRFRLNPFVGKHFKRILIENIFALNTQFFTDGFRITYRNSDIVTIQSVPIHSFQEANPSEYNIHSIVILEFSTEFSVKDRLERSKI